jgi:hypothetical protein
MIKCNVTKKDILQNNKPVQDIANIKLGIKDDINTI